MNLHPVLEHIERDIRHVEEVIREIFLDYIAFVPEANHELIDPVVRVDLHDVPQDRPTPNLDHGLWLEMGFLAYASA